MDQKSRLLRISLDAFWPLLKAGIAFTIPLTLLSFLFWLMLGLLTALARTSKNPALQSGARFYVWIFRGTPLLVQLFARIVLPQAARVAAPPLANSFIALVKDTSLAATLTVPEMFQVAQRITAVTYEPMLLYSEAALIYLIFSSFLSSLQRRLEARLSRHLSPRST